MKTLKYTLIGDGSSDSILMNVIKWILDDIYPTLPSEGVYADFRHLTNPPEKKDIKNQVQTAKKYYPFDILFYHRDAESKQKNIIQQRTDEIRQHLDESDQITIVCIIPIKMMEAWLLFDENAIKKAAGNRNYNGKIELPDMKKVESEKDPKMLLQDLLKTVSGRRGRYLKKFNVSYHIHLVAENIEDFSPLRTLPAFQVFEKELKVAVNKYLST